MKRLLFTIALVALVSVPALAAVTVEQTTDAENLINSGFSQAVAEDVFMQKNRVAGNPVEPLYEKSQNVLVRGFKKLFGYVDPAQEEYDKLHHDVKLSPSFSDL